MKKILALLALATALLAGPALATNCSTYPFTLTNGSTADANQVMSNFNSILSCGNNNLAHSGANGDITSLSGLTSLTLPASSTVNATFTILQGAAPTVPANGNIWTTATGVFARINGSTQQLASASGTVSSFNTRTGAVTLTGSDVTGVNGMLSTGATMTGALVLPVGTTVLAPLDFQAGTSLTSPASGVIEYNGTNFFGTDNVPTRHTFAFQDTGVAKLITARTIAMTGDVTWTSPAFDGSTAVTAAGTIQANAVTNAKLATMAATTIKANVTAGVAVPTDVTIASLQGITSATFAAGNDSRFGGPTPNSQCTYGLVLTDAGGQVYCNTAGAHTLTIPANGSVAFGIGTKVDVVNDCTAGAMTISITTDTLVWFPQGTLGTRILSACGEVTLTKITATRWAIVGPGLT